MLKNKSPSVEARAGKKETQMPSFSHAGHASVKYTDPGVLRCGVCSLFKEGRRKFCAFIGETSSANGACRVDPLSPKFTNWLDAEDERLGMEVEP